MATYREIKRDCERKNHENRQVIERNGLLNADSFWRAASGNFFISGGLERERNSILISKIYNLLHIGSGPIIIFNNSLDLEERLIALAADKSIGQLIVSSECYKNYDVFAGMEFSKVGEFMQSIAQLMHYHNAGKINTYTQAFCGFISLIEPVSLESMVRYSSLDDRAVESEAERLGLNKKDLNVINNGANESESMRSILNAIRTAMSCITSDDCRTGYNLRNYQSIIDGNGIMLIDVNSVTPAIFNQYFAIEIELAVQYMRGGTIILNNMCLTPDDRFGTVIQRYKEMTAMNIGVSTQNLASWVRNSTSGEDLMKNFQTSVVLCSASEDSADLDEVLLRFGEYEHFEPTISGGKTDRFKILTSVQWSSVPAQQRPRVCAADISRYGAAVKGHKGNVVELAKGFRDM